MYVFIGKIFFVKKRLLCAFVCPSWFKETRGLHSVRRSRAPTKYFFRPFPAGSLCRRRTCPGLIPGFFLFFSPPFSSGLPKVKPRVFLFYFILFFRPFPAGSLCRCRTCPGLIPGFFLFFFPALFRRAAQG